jgi:hypothetical protein
VVVSIGLDVPAVDYNVHAGEEGLQVRVVREQVEDLDPFDAVTRGVRVPDSSTSLSS